MKIKMSKCRLLALTYNFVMLFGAFWLISIFSEAILAAEANRASPPAAAEDSNESMAETATQKIKTYVLVGLPIGNWLILSPAIAGALGVSAETYGLEFGGYAMRGLSGTNTTTAGFARGTARFAGLLRLQSIVRIGVARENIYVSKKPEPVRSSSGQGNYNLIQEPLPSQRIGRFESTGANVSFGQIRFHGPFIYGMDIIDLTIPISSRSYPKAGTNEETLNKEFPKYSVRVAVAFFGFYF